MTVDQIKQRFGIIGNSPVLLRAIDIAVQVAPTDLSVLVGGESGVGKENMPQIIHQLSARKHNKYIAVNCGAIPEGTIDSELFGHEKGSFTGANEARKGYFEVADGGTIFLDEVAELPLQTQVRLLRVLETGEFLKVGSSKTQKTNVRIVAATNVNIPEAIKNNKFREDLYYRLNTVPILIPPLRERKEDIYLLFRKFASDFAAKYRMPVVQLTDRARILLENFRWPGNIRQLKNVTEQISVIEKKKEIDESILKNYLPTIDNHHLPAIYKSDEGEAGMNEREILYKVLFDLKRDVTDLKTLVFKALNSDNGFVNSKEGAQIIQRLYDDEHDVEKNELPVRIQQYSQPIENNSAANYEEDETEEPNHEIVEDTLSIADTEKELIKRALKKYDGKRKNASKELGISERTLYRKIKEYNIADL
ncbi:sigma-54 interaction domain-containing protein [Acidiluteibacter ferrifornacis]|uniref:AAA domain-containing protein n=1 Tax=Acidiluteibacter ferrifornacis TaxID=2692424 RepID=A0A6N9NI92_9FLAO|nr:sigma-54 dependent transcriptional regulator [Acidiluteibacter ferrifornacis]MBR9831944.1 sigma-54-dependent Fis family transcriptional regulator [bacterium]NBG65241.1 AAA domain-containing protein [Acidiluteibacter ferrifornacis]